jgi:hypothetical protein
MSESDGTWNATEVSNIITIGSAAIGSVLLILFKSRCSNISFCFGLLSCNRKVKDDDEPDEEEPNPPPPQGLAGRPPPDDEEEEVIVPQPNP